MSFATERVPDRVASEVHLCDNRSHLLLAAADLVARRPVQARLLFSTDQVELDAATIDAFRVVTGVEPELVSDRDAADSFARLPPFLPGMVRRNISVDPSRKPIGPGSWHGSAIGSERFRTGYVYHPGFFLSKVVAAHCDTVVMRDSGYANYVTHSVPLRRALLRAVAGRHPLRQVWGEEPWVDRIQVARPDLLPESVRHKATQLTLDAVMATLSPEQSRRVAEIFWADGGTFEVPDGRLALLLTQPIDQLGFCSFDAKVALYADIAERLRTLGYDIVVKHHPRDTNPILESETEIPADFPIEAWSWLGKPPFARAVSLNSASLAAINPSFAQDTLQLIPPTSFYAPHWGQWPAMIDRALSGERG